MEGERRDVLDQMAEIVRSKPAISARELAVICGWSEPKSVYYWLRKGRYRGLNHFKECVLTREPPPLELRESPAEYGTGVQWPLPGVSFAYRWPSGDAHPFICAGDVLLGSPHPPFRDGDLLLYREAGRLRLAHCYHDNGELRHAPLGAGASLRSGMPRDLIGRVTGVVRPL